MRDPKDSQAVEIEDSEQPKRRGRPPLGASPMTPAERKRASRKRLATAGVRGSDGVLQRLPVPFSCDLDVIALGRLRRAASQQGVPIHALLERLIFDNL